jgi:hypothetical protein
MTFLGIWDLGLGLGLGAATPLVEEMGTWIWRIMRIKMDFWWPCGHTF